MLSLCERSPAPSLCLCSDVRVAVLTGSGTAFSAGGDLKFLQDRVRSDARTNTEAMLAFYNRFLSIRDLRVPIIAAINGLDPRRLARALRVSPWALRDCFVFFVGAGMPSARACAWRQPAICALWRSQPSLVTHLRGWVCIPGWPPHTLRPWRSATNGQHACC